MRKQLAKTVGELLDQDPRTALLLGDIGVFGFRYSFRSHPDRVYNLGILEQSIVGTAAGLAISGMIPIAHTIAPFLVERAYEQLKIDFGYQALGGNFVGVGGSYDYAALGSTHHCPADVGVLKLIPGMEIVVPGTAQEFDQIFRSAYDDGNPTYFRLSETSNGTSQDVTFGKAKVMQKGSGATVIAVGTMLDSVLAATEGLNVTVLYYTTVAPFDTDTLRANCPSGKVLLCEPYYSGVLSAEICEALAPQPVQLACIGVPHIFVEHYGKKAEHDAAFGLTPDGIHAKLEELLDE